MKWLFPGSSRSEYKFCPKCIDDNAYKHLQAIMERNETVLRGVDCDAILR